jgi:hypothetical protein
MGRARIASKLICSEQIRRIILSECRMASSVCLRLSVAFCALQALPALGSGESPATQPETSGAARSLLTLPATSVLDYLPIWSHGSPGPDAAVAPLPGATTRTLLYVRVSREYLSERFEKSVDRTKPLVDLILGTRIHGKSQTIGNTRLLLVPSGDSFQADIEFVGTVHSKSRGENGPAILHLESESTFRATKRIMLDNVGLSAAPAHAVAKTHVHTRGIQSRHPGIMGELVKRIARRRIAKTHSQANAIASDHTAKTVAGDLDRGVAKALAALGESFATAAGLDEIDLKTLTAHRAGETLHIQLRTTADYAEMAMTPEPANWEQLAAGLPKVSGSPHVALRVHRSMMTLVVTGAGSTPPIARLLLATLQARLIAPQSTAASAAATSASSKTPAPQLSIGLDWLAIDVARPADPELAIHNAQLTTPSIVEAPR